jgi:hypothetical protein
MCTTLSTNMQFRQQQFTFDEQPWCLVKDGDDTCRAIFDNHYSRYHYADGRKPKLFVGPGEKLVLMTPDAGALFIWRKFRSADRQVGINCAVFRKEFSEYQASDLILEAMKLAWQRWPGERLYTYVNPRLVRRKRDPGRCFIRAGWKQCGISKKRRYLIFEALP